MCLQHSFLCWCFILCAMFSLKTCLEKNYLAPGFQVLCAVRCPLALLQSKAVRDSLGRPKSHRGSRSDKKCVLQAVYTALHTQVRNVNFDCFWYILKLRPWSSKWKVFWVFLIKKKKTNLPDFSSKLTICNMVTWFPSYTW